MSGRLISHIIFGIYFSCINSMLKSQALQRFFACLFLKYWLFVKERIGPGPG